MRHTAIVAVFDGHCVICHTTRRIVQALDWFNRVEFLDLHDQQQVRARFPQIDRADAMGEIHVIADQNTYRGYRGTRRMMRAVPLGLPLWAVMRLLVIGDWVGPALYRFIARRRYAINRLFGVDLRDGDCAENGCKLPTREARR